MIQEKLDDLEKEMGKKCNDYLEIVKKHQKDEKDKDFKTESKTTDDEKIKTEEGKVWKFESSGIENSGVVIEEDLKTQVKDEA